MPFMVDSIGQLHGRLFPEIDPNSRGQISSGRPEPYLGEVWREWGFSLDSELEFREFRRGLHTRPYVDGRLKSSFCAAYSSAYRVSQSTVFRTASTLPKNSMRSISPAAYCSEYSTIKLANLSIAPIPYLWFMYLVTRRPVN